MFRDAFIDTGDDDVSLFYYFGHGLTDAIDLTGFIDENGEHWSSNYMLYEDLGELISTTVKGEIIVVLDCCSSAAFVSSAYEKMSPSDRRRVSFISSCQADEVGTTRKVSLFNNTWYGPLTLGIGKGIDFYDHSDLKADKNGDKKITLRELYDYASKDVTDANDNMHPVLRTNHEDLVLFEYGTTPYKPVTNKEGFSVEKDGWNFVNGYEGFGYPSNYSIPPERYEKVFGKAYVEAATKPDGSYYNSMIGKGWGGNCFGMSVAAVLFYMNKLDWNKYNDLYVNDFPSVNDYYTYLRYAGSTISQTLYTESSADSEVTELIEKYQILQKSDIDYRYGPDSTYAEMKSEFYVEENSEVIIPDTTPEGIGQAERRIKRLRHKEDGKYIEHILQKVKTASHPLIIGLIVNAGGHAIVVRTDRSPEQMSDGWWRVYVYDPNTPYFPSDLYPDSLICNDRCQEGDKGRCKVFLKPKAS